VWLSNCGIFPVYSLQLPSKPPAAWTEHCGSASVCRLTPISLLLLPLLLLLLLRHRRRRPHRRTPLQYPLRSHRYEQMMISILCLQQRGASFRHAPVSAAACHPSLSVQPVSARVPAPRTTSGRAVRRPACAARFPPRGLASPGATAARGNPLLFLVLLVLEDSPVEHVVVDVALADEEVAEELAAVGVVRLLVEAERAVRGQAKAKRLVRVARRDAVCGARAQQQPVLQRAKP
jgi:hypothetical protein